MCTSSYNISSKWGGSNDTRKMLSDGWKEEEIEEKESNLTVPPTQGTLEVTGSVFKGPDAEKKPQH